MFRRVNAPAQSATQVLRMEWEKVSNMPRRPQPLLVWGGRQAGRQCVLSALDLFADGAGIRPPDWICGKMAPVHLGNRKFYGSNLGTAANP